MEWLGARRGLVVMVSHYFVCLMCWTAQCAGISKGKERTCSIISQCSVIPVGCIYTVIVAPDMPFPLSRLCILLGRPCQSVELLDSSADLVHSIQGATLRLDPTSTAMRSSTTTRNESKIATALNDVGERRCMGIV
jgi:hypothetical protein